VEGRMRNHLDGLEQRNGTAYLEILASTATIQAPTAATSASASTGKPMKPPAKSSTRNSRRDTSSQRSARTGHSPTSPEAVYETAQTLARLTRCQPGAAARSRNPRQSAVRKQRRRGRLATLRR
jgi:hypothetical protein